MWFYRYKGTAIEGRGGVRADQPSWSTHASLHSQAPSHKTEGLESQEEGELGMARDDNGFISECRKGLKMGLQLPCPLAQHYWAHQHSSHTVLRLGYPKNPTATHPDTFHSPRWNSPQEVCIVATVFFPRRRRTENSNFPSRYFKEQSLKEVRHEKCHSQKHTWNTGGI